MISEPRAQNERQHVSKKCWLLRKKMVNLFVRSISNESTHMIFRKKFRNQMSKRKHKPTNVGQIYFKASYSLDIAASCVLKIRTSNSHRQQPISYQGLAISYLTITFVFATDLNFEKKSNLDSAKTKQSSVKKSLKKRHRKNVLEQNCQTKILH